MNNLDSFKPNEVNNNLTKIESKSNFDPDERILTNLKDTNNKLEESLIQNKESSGTESFDPDQRISLERPNHITDDNPNLAIDNDLKKSETPSSTIIEKAIEDRAIVNKDGNVEYYDDHNNLFRINDSLLPNHEYTVNGYTYKTDDQGRITTAEGILHKKSHEGRLDIYDSKEAIGKGDQKESDHRGHLFADQFGGSNGLENIIPQDGNLNIGDIESLENSLAKEVDAGKKVYYKIEPVYESDSNRPEGFAITYTIDDEKTQVYFENGGTD